MKMKINLSSITFVSFLFQNECLTYNKWCSIWNILCKDDLTKDEDSFWLNLQENFNTTTKWHLLKANDCNSRTALRFVLDDDKIHCDGLQNNWDSIKRVKHTVSNRFGANMHTLASSVSGIIYSITTETKHMTTFDAMVKCLSSAFKGKNTNEPALNNAVIGIDRGYSGSKRVVSYILQCGGHTFGTVKRTLNSVFTYDQKRQGQWDNRQFRNKDGARIVERMKAPMKDNDGKEIGQLTSIFYRNGYGGGILMQSTLPEHQSDEWDRIGNKGNNIDVTNPISFFQPLHTSQHQENNQQHQTRLHDHLNSRINIITLGQGTFEWFLCRMFCITASPAQKYIDLGISIREFAEEAHWLTIEGFISDTTQQRAYNVEAIIDSDITPELWAAQAFEDPDTCQLMTSADRINQLKTDTSDLGRKRWRALQKAFKSYSGFSRGETTVSPQDIHEWSILPDIEKILYHQDSIHKMRSKLRERVPKGDDIYKDIKDFNGK